MLTIIEGSVRYRRAFGFKGGDLPGVTSGGIKPAQLCREIAKELFPTSALPVDKLGTSVKNRIAAYVQFLQCLFICNIFRYRIKKSYHIYHKQLGQTGHGLVMEDRTSEIISGTPIYNIFGTSLPSFTVAVDQVVQTEPDKMQKKFKWYKRLHLLLCASPVYDGSALANSATPLDTSPLSILAPGSETALESQLETEVELSQGRDTSPDWDMARLDRSFNDDTNPLSHSSPPADDEPVPPTQSLVVSLSQPPQTPLPSSRTPAPDPPKSVPQKRKSIMDHVKDLSEGRLESVRVRAEGKRQRAQLKEENTLAIEKLKWQAEHDLLQERNLEAQRQREHELKLLDKQILLAQLQAGHSTLPGASAGTTS